MPAEAEWMIKRGASDPTSGSLRKRTRRARPSERKIGGARLSFPLGGARLSCPPKQNRSSKVAQRTRQVSPPEEGSILPRAADRLTKMETIQLGNTNEVFWFLRRLSES